MTLHSCDFASLQFLCDTSDISMSNYSPSFLSNLHFYGLVFRISESVRPLVCTSVRRNSMNTNAAETRLIPFQEYSWQDLTGLVVCLAW